MIRLRAPAKINLAHEVVGRRADGYHEVRSVLQAVDLADEIELREADSLSLRIEPAGSVAIDGNLVLKAARALQQAAGIEAGAQMILRKRIPVAAGLGGGSSDAAATLAGLRRLWAADLNDERLAAIAASLGSDVSFFLRGGTELATGRGELLRPLPSPVEPLAVIVTPQETRAGDKTARLYGLLREHHYGDGTTTTEIVRRIEAGEELGDAIVNTFEQVALAAHPSYETMRAIFGTTQAAHPRLAGAGPSMFALMHDETDANAVRDRMAEAGNHAVVARLLPAWAS